MKTLATKKPTDSVIRNERGSVILFVSLVMVVLLGMAPWRSTWDAPT